MIRIFTVALTAGAAAAATAAPLTPSPSDWRDITIYQIITDRWHDGDPSNNTANPEGTFNPSGGFDIHGGDFAGLTAKLPYLEGLGVGAVWISPIPRNTFGAYHGYAAQNFNQVDPHWGAQTELADFVQQAHARGIRVILDVVANHGGDLIGSFDAGFPAYDPSGSYTLTWWNPARRHAAPFDDLSLFHAHGGIGSFTDPEQIVGELFGLDDLKTEDATVRTEMTNIWTNWAIALDADGFRVDTVKHVDIGFWQTWAPAVRANLAAAGKTNFFMFGEIFDGSEFKVGFYTGTQAGGAFALDSALDYPLHFRTNDVFARANTGAQTIEDHYANISLFYDPAARDRLVTFLDNHDNPRFLSGGLANGDTARLEVALVFLLTSRGVPIVYYGTEQEFNGGNDPFDREDMFDGQFEQGPSLGDDFDQTAPLYRLVRKLNQFRRDHVALRRGSQVVREVHGSPGLYVYSRIASAEEVLVIHNTDPFSARLSNPWPTTFSTGTVLVDLLDPSFTLTVGAGGTISPMTIGASGRHIMAPQSQVTDLEPEVVQVTPSHDQSSVDVASAVTLTFSEAMSQASVESAFSTDPLSFGSFSWNPSGNELLYTPDIDWPVLSTVKVRIAETATDLTGAPLRGGFESAFHTASGPAADPPPAVGPLGLHVGTIIVDGDASDWTGTPGSAETAVIDGAAQELIWVDATSDDLGDGDYTYPTDSVFTGGDADLVEVRIAIDPTTLHLMIRPESVNPGASFFTPYFGVAIDTDQVDGSGRTDLGIEIGLANGGADAIVSSKLAWEIQSCLPGPNPVRLVDAAGQPLPGAHAAFSQASGVVEIALPFAATGNPAGRTWDFVVYAGLETFDQLREIRESNSTWDPGGGFEDDVSGNDPDIFDLAGSTAAQQAAELASYAGTNPARITRSAIVVQFDTAVPVELGEFGVE